MMCRNKIDMALDMWSVTHHVVRSRSFVWCQVDKWDALHTTIRNVKNNLVYVVRLFCFVLHIFAVEYCAGERNNRKQFNLKTLEFFSEFSQHLHNLILETE